MVSGRKWDVFTSHQRGMDDHNAKAFKHGVGCVSTMAYVPRPTNQ